MRSVKTHTFCGKKYRIDFVHAIEGVTNTPEIADECTMDIIRGNDFRAFHAALHESLEASGFCDVCLHFSDGTPRTIDAARFLWRMRRKWKR